MRLGFMSPIRNYRVEPSLILQLVLCTIVFLNSLQHSLLCLGKGVWSQNEYKSNARKLYIKKF